MLKKCKHKNTIVVGDFQKYSYCVDDNTNTPIPGVFEHVEQCEDCGEERREGYYREPEVKIAKNNHAGETYIARETYYTNGGNLVEKDGFSNWYYNGTKMTGSQLKSKMKVLGDSLGDQDVSDNFKEYAYAAKNQVQQSKAKKAERLEEIRDAW